MSRKPKPALCGIQPYTEHLCLALSKSPRELLLQARVHDLWSLVPTIWRDGSAAVRQCSIRKCAWGGAPGRESCREHEKLQAVQERPWLLVLLVVGALRSLRPSVLQEYMLLMRLGRGLFNLFCNGVF